MNELKLTPIAIAKNNFKTKFGLPRGGMLSPEIKTEISLLSPYATKDAVRGLEGYSHIWLLWGFSENNEGEVHLTVRPPRLGGNKRMGVFATRAPYRPNPIGLSCVRLDGISYENGVTLTVYGADMKDGTPIYDIKPYLSHTDSVPDAKCGFAEEVKDYGIEVLLSDGVAAVLTDEERKELIAALSGDPRPSYHEDGRTYGFLFSAFEVKFKVENGVLEVTSIEKA